MNLLGGTCEVQPGSASSGMLRSGVRSGELDVCFVFDGVSTEPDLLSIGMERGLWRSWC